MRVLHVYKTYFPATQGGIEEAIRQNCANTRRHGVESRVFCLCCDPDPPVVHLPEADVYRAAQNIEIASCGFSLQALKIFQPLVRWADILQYHFPWPFADVLHLCSRVKKPVIISYQSDIVRQKGLMRLYRPLMQSFLSSADYIVASSPNYAASSDILAKYRNKIKIIPIGLDRHNYPEPSAAILRRIRSTFGDNYFLFIGVLRYYKGLHILLQAAQHLDANIVIAGSGPEENNLKQQARQLGLDNVHFLGFVDDATKVALIRYALAIVFPSNQRSEAYGVTLIEGAMFGKPLVTVEIGSGMSYINTHNITGFTVPPDDVPALCNAMKKLHDNRHLAVQMGERARQRYAQLFTGTRMGDLYNDLYNQVYRQHRQDR